MVKFRIFTKEIDTFCKLSNRHVKHTVEFCLVLDMRDGFAFQLKTSNVTFTSRNPFRALWSAVVRLSEATVKYEAVKENAFPSAQESMSLVQTIATLKTPGCPKVLNGAKSLACHLASQIHAYRNLEDPRVQASIEGGVTLTYTKRNTADDVVRLFVETHNEDTSFVVAVLVNDRIVQSFEDNKYLGNQQGILDVVDRFFALADAK